MHFLRMSQFLSRQRQLLLLFFWFFYFSPPVVGFWKKKKSELIFKSCLSQWYSEKEKKRKSIRTPSVPEGRRSQKCVLHRTGRLIYTLSPSARSESRSAVQASSAATCCRPPAQELRPKLHASARNDAEHLCLCVCVREKEPSAVQP